MNQLALAITKALSGNREELIREFRMILQRYSGDPDLAHNRFWLAQLERTSNDELPITLFGVSQATHSLEVADLVEGAPLGEMLWHICADVFSYSRDDGGCDMQGTYHYYFFIPDGVVFKESELGDCDLEATILSFEDEVRVATVSELGVPADELLH